MMYFLHPLAEIALAEIVKKTIFVFLSSSSAERLTPQYSDDWVQVMLPYINTNSPTT